ncbi:MAG: alpha/beta fold hydrolase [Acidobacteriaceae bacterium]
MNRLAIPDETIQTERLELVLDGKRTEVTRSWISSARGNILLLHEALGSVSYWKSFPHDLVHATGYNVIAYSRAGHGNSEGPLSRRTSADYHRQVNEVIPGILDFFKVTQPVLYGHSEGVGVALFYAATAQAAEPGSAYAPGDASMGASALILESPYIIPTDAARYRIQKMKEDYPGSKLQERLTHYHQHPNEVFYSWIHWAADLTDQVFPLRELLPRVSCPVLVLQGEQDEFGGSRQVEALQESIPHLQYRSFPHTGHLPHREQSEEVLRTVSAFLSRLQPKEKVRKP